MGNCKLANGCQEPSGKPAPDANGLLSRAPGQYVAQASLSLPTPTPGNMRKPR